MKWLWLGAAGIGGTFLRYLLSSFTQHVLGFHFPYGTLLVNILGCGIAGFFYVLSEEKGILDENTRLIIQIGFYGAFTTLSSFTLETMTLLRNHEIIMASVNVIITLIGAFVAFVLGCFLAECI